MITPRRRPWAIVMLFLALAGGEAPADDSPRPSEADALFREAYFLEVELAKYEEAFRAYEKVADLETAPKDLRERARGRAQGCREALRAADLLSLLPADALVHAEVSRPGAHLRQLLQNMGLTAGDGEPETATRTLISPRLLAALETVEGAAAALTDFDHRRGEPRGVAVLNTGRSDAVHGLLETFLAGALRAKEVRQGAPIRGHATYETPFGTIALTRRLVLAGTSRELVAAAVERLEKGEATPREPGDGLAQGRERRRDALANVLLNAKPLLARVKEDLLRSERDAADYQRIQAFTDLESVRSISLRLASEGAALSLELTLDLDESNHALAYHLLRSPAAGKDVLRGVPAGAAGFLAFGLAEGGNEDARASARSKEAPSVTGLDIGRELFANIRDVALFVLPPQGNTAGAREVEAPEADATAAARKPEGDGKPGAAATVEGKARERRLARAVRRARRGRDGALPVPDAALVLTVRDPARSEMLWSQILSVVALLARPGGDDVRTETVAGRPVRVFALPEGVTLRIASLADRVILATSAIAVERAMGAAGGKESVLDDAGFAKARAQLPAEASKMVAVHVGRMIEIALALGAGPKDVPQDLIEALDKTAVLLSTREEPSRFQARLSLEVPRLDGMLDKLLGAAARGREGRMLVEDQGQPGR